MNPVDIAAMFTLGLAGSVHCVQMCGPIVLAYGLPMSNEPRWRQVAAHASYHAGRISIYGLIGAIAGLVGSSVEWVGRLAGIAHAAAIVAGIGLLIAGVVMLIGTRRNALIRIGAPSRLSRATARLLQSSSVLSKAGMGMLLGFLPCGLIYAAVVKSVTSASASGGAMEMIAFGLGTAGPLAAVGFCSPWLGRWVRGVNVRFAGVWVMLIGAFLLWRGALPVAAAHCH